MSASRAMSAGAKSSKRSKSKTAPKRTTKSAARAMPKRTMKPAKRTAPKRKRSLIQKIIHPFG